MARNFQGGAVSPAKCLVIAICVSGFVVGITGADGKKAEVPANKLPSSASTVGKMEIGPNGVPRNHVPTHPTHADRGRALPHNKLPHPHPPKAKAVIVSPTPPSAGATESEIPVPPPPEPVAKHPTESTNSKPRPPSVTGFAGTWKANPTKDVTINLAIQPDKTFRWTVNGGKATGRPMTGEFTYGGETLALMQTNGTSMVGWLAWEDDNHFRFRIAGPLPKNLGLEFSR